MLKGQDIGFMDSFIISMTGMFVVMLELALLAILVIVLSKIVSLFNKPKDVINVSGSLEVPNISENKLIQDDEDDDIAIVMSTVCEESGLRMEEIIFKSIERK